MFQYKKASNKKYNVVLIDDKIFVNELIGQVPKDDIEAVYNNLQDFDTDLYYDQHDRDYKNAEVTIAGRTIPLNTTANSSYGMGDTFNYYLLKSFKSYEEKLCDKIRSITNPSAILNKSSRNTDGIDTDSDSDINTDSDSDNCSYFRLESPNKDYIDTIMNDYTDENIVKSKLYQLVVNNARTLHTIEESGPNIITMAKKINTQADQIKLLMEQNAKLKEDVLSHDETIKDLTRKNEILAWELKDIKSDKATYKQNLLEELKTVINKH